MVIPPELYRPIIQNVRTKGDLHNLLFVSRIVSYEAERLLYVTIHVSANDLPSPMGLFIHLSRCTRVARYVQELGFWGVVSLDDVTEEEPEIQDPDKYWYFLNQALCALTHLRALTLSTWLIISPEPRPDFSFPPPDIFSNCTFKLEVLTLTDYSTREFHDIDLTHLEELSFGYIYQDDRSIKFLPDAFRSLKVLTASPAQFLKLGTRNTDSVRALELCDTPHWFIKKTFANVTSLKIYSSPHDRIQGFPSLRYLLTLTTVADLNMDTRLSNLFETLMFLKNLEKLSVVIYESLNQRRPDLHIKFFTALGSLTELILSNSQGGLLWHRDGSEPVIITTACIQDEWKNPRWLGASQSVADVNS